MSQRGIVINTCYGGFGLSAAAVERLKELGYEEDPYEIERDDPRLVQVVEELGSERASGDYARLRVVWIPEGIEWEIDYYDGKESVHETHRSWS